MKKNNVFWSMLILSAAIHGSVMIAAGNVFYTPPAVPKNQFVSTIKMTKPVTKPQTKTPSTPSKPLEKQIVEKPVEIPPERPPVQEAASNEEAREEEDAQEGDTGNNEEAQEGNETQGSSNDSGNHEALQEGMTEESQATTDREYEVLLAYIKDFISKNLIYPPIARRRNIEGIVGISFTIETNGDIISVSVNSSSGSSMLDNAAVSLINKIRPLGNITITKKFDLRVNIKYKLTE